MRKITYLLLIFLTLPLAWSCNKDDDEGNLSIPKGWTENGDLYTMSKASWFLYRSADGDSIRLSLYQIGGRGTIYSRSYKKNKKGDYYNSNYFSIERASSIEKDGKKELYGLSGEGETCRIGYEMIDNNTFIIHNLPTTTLTGSMEFKAVKDSKYNDKNNLIGGWYNSQVIDSTVLVFEKDMIKEYLFVRGASVIQNYWELGSYSAYYTESYLDKELVGIDRRFLFYKSDIKNCEYRIQGDNLTIYWESPGKTTTYKRIKN